MTAVFGEDVLKDEVVFLEKDPVFSDATTSIDITRNNNNKRYSFPVICDGTVFNNTTLSLSKSASLPFDVYVRLETDNN